jgi:hypothetical protein
MINDDAAQKVIENQSEQLAKAEEYESGAFHASEPFPTANKPHPYILLLIWKNNHKSSETGRE